MPKRWNGDLPPSARLTTGRSKSDVVIAWDSGTVTRGGKNVSLYYVIKRTRNGIPYSTQASLKHLLSIGAEGADMWLQASREEAKSRLKNPATRPKYIRGVVQVNQVNTRKYARENFGLGVSRDAFEILNAKAAREVRRLITRAAGYVDTHNKILMNAGKRPIKTIHAHHLSAKAHAAHITDLRGKYGGIVRHRIAE